MNFRLVTLKLSPEISKTLFSKDGLDGAASIRGQLLWRPCRCHAQPADPAIAQTQEHIMPPTPEGVTTPPAKAGSFSEAARLHSGFSGNAGPSGRRSRLTARSGRVECTEGKLQDIPGGVLVPVEFQVTVRTAMHAHTQGFPHDPPAATADLRRVGGVDQRDMGPPAETEPASQAQAVQPRRSASTAL